jgi:valyl-tRNA synthetase
MAKSRGNVVTPMHLIEQYGADAIRYWAAGARLGTDTAFDDKVLEGREAAGDQAVQRRQVRARARATPRRSTPSSTARSHRLRTLVTRVSAAFDDFEYAQALQETERRSSGATSPTHPSW